VKGVGASRTDLCGQRRPDADLTDGRAHAGGRARGGDDEEMQ
jgi:hypothetical protein